MSTPRPRRFHRVYVRRQVDAAPPRCSDVSAAAALARRPWGRFLLGAVLLLASSGPAWSIGKTLVELYHDEPVRRSPLSVAKSTPHALPRLRTANPAAASALLLPPSDMEGAPTVADDQAFLEGISLELTNSCPSAGVPLLLPPAGPAPAGLLAAVGNGALPPIDGEAAGGTSFTGAADAYQVAAVPEPAAWACLAVGTTGAVMATVRRRWR